MLTQERVKELFHLKDGRLFRKFRSGKAAAGSTSLCKDRDGYLVVGIDGKLYRAHRVVWLYVHGFLPDMDVDHINRVKDDNRPSNLRLLTRSQNKQNQLKTKQNSTGFKGVYLHKQTGRYVAEIVSEGKRFYLGVHETPELAAAAYAEAAARVHEYNPLAKKRG